MNDIKNYTFEELQETLSQNNRPRFLASQVFNWVYKKRITDFTLMSDISKENRIFLADNFYLSRFQLLKREVSRDKTEKFLFELKDKNSIETVLIPEMSRYTLCLSTQVGCKYKCSFCISGESGLKRNLEPEEIINQYLEVALIIAPRDITNLVFMGIGEPLDNFDNVVKAIKLLISPKGLNFSKRRISLSTCGLAPEIEKLAGLNLGIKLSVSLHSANNEIRSQIMPVNKKYSLERLMAAVKKYSFLQRYPVTLEYIMIKGINISIKDAKDLVKLLNAIKCKLNLIAYNGSKQTRIPSGEEIATFKAELNKKGIFATLRKSKGQDINAACGQLKAIFS
ncbi:MAG: 23S rRNA (adenine(2503)-C(2))-methyltransferase RlmN [Candidatus Omnitrophica bacterium]|jgi:23S rRNA (adenine2503-C2)-methyltransferase|nr:23S rRNA (adenine(2503)-C(2))-methyltransferase RlmN [Candidatus Omnitrophota bacterium]